MSGLFFFWMCGRQCVRGAALRVETIINITRRATVFVQELPPESKVRRDLRVAISYAPIVRR